MFRWIWNLLMFIEISEGYLFLLHEEIEKAEHSCPAISAFQPVKSTAIGLQLLQKTSRAMPLKTSQ